MTRENGRADRAFDFWICMGYLVFTHATPLNYIVTVFKKMTFQGQLASESQLILSQDPGSCESDPEVWLCSPKAPLRRVWVCTPAAELLATGAAFARSGCQVGLCLSPGSCYAVSRERKTHGAGGLLHHFLRPVQMGAHALPFIHSQYPIPCPRIKAC